MKIYTRKGDGGQTGIWGGVRLAKDEARMEVIGTVDELNAVIGLAVAAARDAGCFDDEDGVRSLLGSVQQDLLVAGTELMAPGREGSGASLPRLAGTDPAHLTLLAASRRPAHEDVRPRGHSTPRGTPGSRCAGQPPQPRWAPLPRCADQRRRQAAESGLLFHGARAHQLPPRPQSTTWSTPARPATRSRRPVATGLPPAPPQEPLQICNRR